MQNGCLVNPFAGNEGVYNTDPVDEPKNVVVVGAGPAGLYAAWISAKRGHNVTVIEKQEKIGGSFRIAGIPPAKHEIMNMIKHSIFMCEKYGVTIKTGMEFTEEMAKHYDPDIIILATGGVPMVPPIKGLNDISYLTVADVLEGKADTGSNVAIAGGGEAGAETALFLAQYGKRVTVFEMLPDIASEAQIPVRVPLLKNLDTLGVQCIVNAKITEVSKGMICYEKEGETVAAKGFDSIVLALGVSSNNTLEESLKDSSAKVYVVGDALKPGQANKAIEEATKVALEI